MEKVLPCGFTLKVVDKDFDMYLDMALSMLDVIQKCAR